MRRVGGFVHSSTCCRRRTVFGIDRRNELQVGGVQVVDWHWNSRDSRPLVSLIGIDVEETWTDEMGNGIRYGVSEA